MKVSFLIIFLLASAFFEVESNVVTSCFTDVQPYYGNYTALILDDSDGCVYIRLFLYWKTTANTCHMLEYCPTDKVRVTSAVYQNERFYIKRAQYLDIFDPYTGTLDQFTTSSSYETETLIRFNKTVFLLGATYEVGDKLEILEFDQATKSFNLYSDLKSSTSYLYGNIFSYNCILFVIGDSYQLMANHDGLLVGPLHTFSDEFEQNQFQAVLHRGKMIFGQNYGNYNNLYVFDGSAVSTITPNRAGSLDDRFVDIDNKLLVFTTTSVKHVDISSLSVTNLTAFEVPVGSSLKAAFLVPAYDCAKFTPDFQQYDQITLKDNDSSIKVACGAGRQLRGSAEVACPVATRIPQRLEIIPVCEEAKPKNRFAIHKNQKLAVEPTALVTSTVVMNTYDCIIACGKNRQCLTAVFNRNGTNCGIFATNMKYFDSALVSNSQFDLIQYEPN